ncbi:MAG: outer membrane protein assembly factor BamC [Perlucidibaca sp.]
MRRLLTVVVAATLLPACSGFFRDRSLDYVKAESTPGFDIPANVNTRPIQPLYPIPPAAADAPPVTQPVKAPFPPAMGEVKVVELPPLPNLPGRTVVKFGTDGNGVPELRVVGPRERVWDELGRALRNADVTVEDRNQSLGLIDISIAKQKYQMRMVRATEAFVISVQRDDDTLAPVNLSRNLLGTLQARWP